MLIFVLLHHISYAVASTAGVFQAAVNSDGARCCEIHSTPLWSADGAASTQADGVDGSGMQQQQLSVQRCYFIIFSLQSVGPPSRCRHRQDHPGSIHAPRLPGVSCRYTSSAPAADGMQSALTPPCPWRAPGAHPSRVVASRTPPGCRTHSGPAARPFTRQFALAIPFPIINREATAECVVA